MEKRKYFSKKIVLLILGILLMLTTGVSYAYFTNKSTSSGDGAKISEITKITDSLSYSVNKNIGINIGLDNFGKDGGTIGDNTDLTVTLTNNSKEIATYYYYVILDMKANTFIYSTSKGDEVAELMLQVTDPNGEEVTEIDGLIYKTITDKDGNIIKGFDITQERDSIVIADHYQISGSTSVDQKWHVEVKFINLDENQNANVSRLIDAKLIAQAEPLVEYTMYNWNDVPVLSNNIAASVETLNNIGITSLYHCFKLEDFTTGRAESVMKSLSAKNVSTYWLTGDASWFDNPEFIKSKIDVLINYNKNNPTNRIKGIVLDIEWYTVAKNREDYVNNFVTYVNTLEEVYNYAKSKGILLVNCITYTYDNMFNESSTYTEEEQERAKDAFDRLIKNCDRVSVMNYQVKTMVDRISKEVEVAKKYNKKVESIADFGKYVPGSENQWSTLERDPDPINYAKSLWREIDEAYNYHKMSYSYHYLSEALYISGVYDRFEMNMTIDGTASESKNIQVKFDSGEVAIVPTDNRNFYLPKDGKYTISVDKAKILSNTITENEDGSKVMNMDISNKNYKTLEIYPSLYNESTGKYVGLGSGKIKFMDVINGNIFYSKEINPSGKYATVAPYTFYDDTEYKVTYVDSMGIEYPLEQALLNLNGESVEISNEAKNVFVSSDLISKDKTAIVPKLYFKKN